MDIYKYLEQNFKLIKQEKYRNYNFSDITKKILCDIGLPKEPVYFIHFNIDQVDSIGFNGKNFVIGNDLGTDICINPNEEIVSIDPQQIYPTRFINTNLECFIGFIAIYLSYSDRIADASDEEINDIMTVMKKDFNLTDARALHNAENWWSIILEQIELGMM